MDSDVDHPAVKYYLVDHEQKTEFWSEDAGGDPICGTLRSARLLVTILGQMSRFILAFY